MGTPLMVCLHRSYKKVKKKQLEISISSNIYVKAHCRDGLCQKGGIKYDIVLYVMSFCIGLFLRDFNSFPLNLQLWLL